MQGDLNRRPTLASVATTLLALALFTYFLRRAGIDDVGEGIRRLGGVFIIVVLLGGVRFAIRAAAWIKCLDGPHRLTVTEVFKAVVVGDSLGNLTPLSILVSEPAKGMFLRHREPLNRTLPALAIENLFYTLSAILVIGGGMIATLLMFQTPTQLGPPTVILVLTLAGLVVAVHWTIWKNFRIGSGVLNWFKRRGLTPEILEQFSARVRNIEETVYTLYPRHRNQLVSLAFLEFSFHLVAILEVFLILSVVSPVPTNLLHAFIFEATNRFISFAFRFVPLRVGVDEAGSGMFAELLAVGTATGVTLALIRKGRILVWIAIGVLFLLRHGLSLKQILKTGSHKVAVVIMARSPVSGAPPKTRLSEIIHSETDRRRLYSAFLRDTVQACRTIDGVSIRLAYTPESDRNDFAAMPIGLVDDELLAQRGNDLGEREEGVFEDLFADGFTKIVMVGSDLPTLPIDYIEQAVSAVTPKTIVLGPALDGGYYLIALSSDTNRSVPDLFTGIRWSSAHTLADTILAAEQSGLDVKLLPQWYDVDDKNGLERLRSDVKALSIQAQAPTTTKILREIFKKTTSP